MIFAAYRDTGYDIVLFLHVVTVIVATAGAVAHPLMFTLEERRADGDVVTLAKRIETPSRIYAISFAVAGIIGFGLVTMGDLEWGDMWLSISMALWLAANGVLHAVLLPTERAVAAGDTAAMSKLKTVALVVAAMILVMIFLMVVKPGASGNI